MESASDEEDGCKLKSSNSKITYTNLPQSERTSKVDDLDMENLYQHLGDFYIFPDEIRSHILSYLSAGQLVVICRLNKLWNWYCQDEILWKNLYKLTWKSEPFSYKKTEFKNWKRLYAKKNCATKNWKTGVHSKQIVTGHKQPITCLQFDDKHLVTGASDGSMIIWDFKHITSRVDILEDYSDPHATPVRVRVPIMHTEISSQLNLIYCLCFEDNTLVSGSHNGKINIWDLNTGKLKDSLIGHSSGVCCIEFIGNIAMSGGGYKDAKVKIWDLNALKSTHQIQCTKSSVTCLQFDENKIVVGSKDKNIQVVDRRSNKSVMTLVGHKHWIWKLQYDENEVVSSSYDGTIGIWDLRNGKKVGMVGKGEPVMAVMMSGDKIVSGGSDCAVKVWGRNERELWCSLSGHTGAVRDLQFTDDLLVTGGEDGTAVIWDFGKKKGKDTLPLVYNPKVPCRLHK